MNSIPFVRLRRFSSKQLEIRVALPQGMNI